MIVTQYLGARALSVNGKVDASSEGDMDMQLGIAYLFPEKDTFGIYYRKSDAKLGKALKTAIAKLRKNGTLKKLAAKQQIPAGDVK